MKLRCIFLLAASLMTATSVFSEGKKIKLKEPGLGQVIVMGKVNFIYEHNQNLLADLAALPNTEGKIRTQYERPRPVYANYSKKRESLPNKIENGEYFYDICWAQEMRITYNRYMDFNIFREGKESKYNSGLHIKYPCAFTFAVNDISKVKAYYIGTINCKLSSTEYEVEKIWGTDEFEEAQMKINEIVGKKVPLCRAELENICY